MKSNTSNVYQRFMVFGIQTRIEMWKLLYAYSFNVQYTQKYSYKQIYLLLHLRKSKYNKNHDHNIFRILIELKNLSPSDFLSGSLCFTDPTGCFSKDKNANQIQKKKKQILNTIQTSWWTFAFGIGGAERKHYPW